jgi:membrane protein implicated in regulation of membrane protease activity
MMKTVAMKIIGVPVLVTVMLFGLMLLLDILQGYTVKLSINHILNPFSTMRPAEGFVFTILSVLLIVYYWKVLSQAKKAEENTDEK